MGEARRLKLFAPRSTCFVLYFVIMIKKIKIIFHLYFQPTVHFTTKDQKEIFIPSFLIQIQLFFIQDSRKKNMLSVIIFKVAHETFLFDFRHAAFTNIVSNSREKNMFSSTLFTTKIEYFNFKSRRKTV